MNIINVGKIAIDRIVYDRYFQLSNQLISEALAGSIKGFGVISPLLLIEAGDSFRIVSGHNRYNAAKENGLTELPAIVLGELTSAILLETAAYKEYHGSLSSIGKFNLVKILWQDYHFDTARLKEVCRTFKINPEMADNPDLYDKILKKGSDLTEYIDLRELSYKDVMLLLSLPNDIVDQLSLIVAQHPLRLNIFREILTLVSGILRLDKNIDILSKLMFDMELQQRELEETLIERLQLLRYPQYSIAQKEGVEIVSRYAGKGIRIILPKYFEGNQLEIGFSVKRKEGYSGIENSLAAITEKDIVKLFSLIN